MSRLDGNERWQSKMLLTEHHEQYEEKKTVKKTGQPTPEELTMIRDYVLLPHMLTMVQKNIDELERSSSLLKRMFLLAAQVLQNHISTDMYDLRRELSRRRIKVMNDEQIDLIVYHSFVCRGYVDRLGIVREVMRAEIGVRLTKYMGEIAQQLK